MEKAFSKRTLLILATVLLLAVLSIPLFMDKDTPEKLKDTEFQSGSGIVFTQATDLQLENLHTLAKVWGFVKYRHPAVTGGTLNWDAELFRVLPTVLEAGSTAQANTAMLDWLNQFPFTVPELDEETAQAKKELESLTILATDLSWISDSQGLGDGLSAYLVQLSSVTVLDSEKSYAAFPPNALTADMGAEKAYANMEYDDTGLRLLGLFRYWNVIEYFYPYTDIIEEDWDGVLAELLPQFISGQDEQSYLLSIAHLTTKIHDSHGSVNDKNQGLKQYFGTKMPPVEFVSLDGKIVISAVAADSQGTANLQPGDIILSMDGISIADRIANCKRYVSLSHDDRFARRFRYYLLGTNQDTATIEVLRDNQPLSLTVACREERSLLSGQTPSSFIEQQERIGYINPAKLAQGDLDKLMEQFQNTAGLVVDLRQYPSDFIVFTLAEYLLPTPVPFASFGMCNPLTPGTFMQIPPMASGRSEDSPPDAPALYPGKVVLLMDETSISQAEYTIMSLRNAPNGVVLGSPSIGADGNVAEFVLPGAVTTSITGLSILYPDGRQTQRVGLEPDIYCLPTIEDIKAGRDTLVDKAVELILQ